MPMDELRPMGMFATVEVMGLPDYSFVWGGGTWLG